MKARFNFNLRMPNIIDLRLCNIINKLQHCWEIMACKFFPTPIPKLLGDKKG
jgi:hypothetical protein